MLKVNEKYTQKDFDIFFETLCKQMRSIANEAILYACTPNKTPTSMQNAIIKAQNTILHEADNIFMKEGDNK